MPARLSGSAPDTTPAPGMSRGGAPRAGVRPPRGAPTVPPRPGRRSARRAASPRFAAALDRDQLAPRWQPGLPRTEAPEHHPVGPAARAPRSRHRPQLQRLLPCQVSAPGSAAEGRGIPVNVQRAGGGYLRPTGRRAKTQNTQHEPYRATELDMTLASSMAPCVRPLRVRDRFRRALSATRQGGLLLAAQTFAILASMRRRASSRLSLCLLWPPLIDIDIGGCGDFDSRYRKLRILKDNHDES
jgi:hypothetical protein